MISMNHIKYKNAVNEGSALSGGSVYWEFIVSVKNTYIVQHLYGKMMLFMYKNVENNRFWLNLSIL